MIRVHHRNITCEEGYIYNTVKSSVKLGEFLIHVPYAF